MSSVKLHTSILPQLAIVDFSDGLLYWCSQQTCLYHEIIQLIVPLLLLLCHGSMPISILLANCIFHLWRRCRRKILFTNVDKVFNCQDIFLLMCWSRKWKFYQWHCISFIHFNFSILSILNKFIDSAVCPYQQMIEEQMQWLSPFIFVAHYLKKCFDCDHITLESWSTSCHINWDCDVGRKFVMLLGILLCLWWDYS